MRLLKGRPKGRPLPDGTRPPATRQAAGRGRRLRRPFMTIASLFASATLVAQGTVSQEQLLRPTPDSWPMYNGDYSGRRFSPLTRIDTATISAMTLAWVYRPNP